MPRLVAAVLFVLSLAPAAGANVGPPPYRPGSIMEEVRGAAEVHIEHERLSFDLRPLADGGAVPVRAEYRLRNPGAARVLELVFVGSQETAGDAVVTLDGEQV